MHTDYMFTSSLTYIWKFSKNYGYSLKEKIKREFQGRNKKGAFSLKFLACRKTFYLSPNTRDILLFPYENECFT